MHDTASRSNVIISGGIFIFAQTTIGWASYGPVIIAGVKINTFSDSRKAFSKKNTKLKCSVKIFLHHRPQEHKLASSHNGIKENYFLSILLSFIQI